MILLDAYLTVIVQLWVETDDLEGVVDSSMSVFTFCGVPAYG